MTSSQVWRKSSRSDGGGEQCVEVAAIWRKSSHSSGGEGHCVEAAAMWRKSSHSSSGSNQCVEVATLKRQIAVRDSKNPDGAILRFGSAAWATFTQRLKQDH